MQSEQSSSAKPTSDSKHPAAKKNTSSSIDVTHKISLDTLVPPSHNCTASKAEQRNYSLRSHTSSTTKSTSFFTQPFFESRSDIAEILAEQTRVLSQLYIESINISKSDDISLNELHSLYEVGDAIAEGGQGILTCSRDKSLKRLVALKSLRQELRNNPQARECFLAEAQVTAQLDHPTIVPIYSLNRDNEDGLHLAMKLVKGQTLHEYLDKVIQHYQNDGILHYDFKRSLRTHLEILLQVCDAISYAHSRNVMHCDLKPDNIMLGEYHETYIMDWGIAKLIYQKDGQTLTSESASIMNGTPRFMPPEAFNRQGRDKRSDIFALGAILFEIVTLQKAFDGKTTEEVIDKIRKHSRAPLRHRFKIKIDKDLRAIIDKAMSPRPAERYQLAEDLSEDIRRYLRNEEVSANPDNFLGRINRWSMHHRRFCITAVAVVILFLVFLHGATAYLQMRETVRLQGQERIVNLAYNNVAAAANVLDRHIAYFERTLTQISDNATFFLENGNAHLPAGTEAHMHRYQEYNSPQTLPASAVFSPAYNLTIDPDNISYLVPSTQQYTQIEKDLQRLLPMQKIMQKCLFESQRQLPYNNENVPVLLDEMLNNGLPILWLYFTLNNGLHISYPGNGSYNEHYDPRQRGWYQAGQKAQGKPTWNMPYQDECSLKTIVLTCSKAMISPQGLPLGVAALDMPVESIRDTMRQSGTQSYAVAGKFLVDKSGRILVHTGNYDIDASTPDLKGNSTLETIPRHLYLDMRWKKYGSKIWQSGDIEVLYVYAYLPSINCTYLEKIWMLPWWESNLRLTDR